MYKALHSVTAMKLNVRMSITGKADAGKRSKFLHLHCITLARKLALSRFLNFCKTQSTLVSEAHTTIMRS